MNLGVADNPSEKELTIEFRSAKTFASKVDTLENILSELNVKDKISFIKMDIEGFEAEVVRESLAIMKEADIISIELHGTKQKIDEALLPYGFLFEPISMWYIYKKIVKCLFLHPANFYKAYVDAITKNPSVAYRAITGLQKILTF